MTNKSKTDNTFSKTPRTLQRVQGVFSYVKQKNQKAEQASAQGYATDKSVEGGEHAAQKSAELGYKTLIKTKEAIKYQIKRHADGKANSQSGPDKADIKTKESTIKRDPKTKNRAGVKTKPLTVKQTKRQVYASQKHAQTAAKKAKRAVQNAKKTSAAAKKAVRETVKTTKKVVKSVITAARAAASALKSLVVAIATGGWMVIVIILVITLVVVLAASPWGIFFEDTDDATPTAPELVETLNRNFENRIASIIADAGKVDEILMDNESDAIQYQPYNWPDVLGVYSVKLSANPDQDAYLDVLVMDQRRVKALESVFWDMNVITYKIIETEVEPEPTPNNVENPKPEPTPQIVRTLTIHIESLTYAEAAELYGFTKHQDALLDELMSAEYYAMFMELCGMDTYIGLTPEQLENLINNLPVGTLGSEIVKHAASRLGDPYSQALRGQGSYVDCSYLSRWCYQQAGVTSFTTATAAAQAEYCINNQLTVAKSDLQPGDLIFWSFNTNGRFMNIGHVGVYAGNGMVIDASYSKGMVVYRPIFASNNQVCYGRPHVK
ncbi:MAG: NlpC/P60 family protein [Eubacteriales bacterium]